MIWEDITKSKALLQGVMAVASFTVGTVIACVSLFAIEPIGEISDSSTRIVTEMLILCAGCLGVTAYVQKTKDELNVRIDKLEHNK